MTPNSHLLLLACLALLTPAAPAQHVLPEAEQFADTGGWDMDQQSMDQMGSPCLLAHGLGVPVRDAVLFSKEAAFVPPNEPAALVALLCSSSAIQESRGSALERAFVRPPRSAQPWAYWWWLDGAASRDGITADFEAMKQQGIAGVLLFDAGVGGTNAPKGPVFIERGLARVVPARPARGGPAWPRDGSQLMQRLECRRHLGDA